VSNGRGGWWLDSACRSDSACRFLNAAVGPHTTIGSYAAIGPYSAVCPYAAVGGILARGMNGFGSLRSLFEDAFHAIEIAAFDKHICVVSRALFQAGCQRSDAQKSLQTVTFRYVSGPAPTMFVVALTGLSANDAALCTRGVGRRKQPAPNGAGRSCYDYLHRSVLSPVTPFLRRRCLSARVQMHQRPFVLAASIDRDNARGPLSGRSSDYPPCAMCAG
jgi:hypothetical protein